MMVRTVVLALALLLLVAGPVSAGGVGTVQRAPDVAEINYFELAECENLLYFETASEINNWAYRVEHPASGWQSGMIYGGQYPSVRGMTYAVQAPEFADVAGEYWLRVFFDNGTSRMEDVAERICEWERR